jgi:hypothetical protein
VAVVAMFSIVSRAEASLLCQSRDPVPVWRLPFARKHRATLGEYATRLIRGKFGAKPLGKTD